MCPGRISGLFWTLLGGTDRPPVRVDKGRGGKGEGGERVFVLRPPRSRAWLNDALGVTGAPDGNGLRTTLFSTPGGREEGVYERKRPRRRRDIYTLVRSNMHSIHTIQYVYTYRVRARTLRVAAPRATHMSASSRSAFGDMGRQHEPPSRRTRSAGTMHTLE